LRQVIVSLISGKDNLYTYVYPTNMPYVKHIFRISIQPEQDSYSRLHIEHILDITYNEKL